MAGNWTLHIEQGATFDTTLTWKNAAGTPVDGWWKLPSSRPRLA